MAEYPRVTPRDRRNLESLADAGTSKKPKRTPARAAGGYAARRYLEGMLETGPTYLLPPLNLVHERLMRSQLAAPSEIRATLPADRASRFADLGNNVSLRVPVPDPLSWVFEAIHRMADEVAAGRSHAAEHVEREFLFEAEQKRRKAFARVDKLNKELALTGTTRNQRGVTPRLFPGDESKHFPLLYWQLVGFGFEVAADLILDFIRAPAEWRRRLRKCSRRGCKHPYWIHRAFRPDVRFCAEHRR